MPEESEANTRSFVCLILKDAIAELKGGDRNAIVTRRITNVSRYSAIVTQYNAIVMRRNAIVTRRIKNVGAAMRL